MAAGREALAAGAPAVAAQRLEEALALWRGPALADLRYEEFAQAQIARLEDLRASALEDRITAELQLGRHKLLVGELEQLVAEHPYRERLAAALMTALYRSGRQADALQVYRRTRRLLVEELGIEPGRELKEVERAVLAQDAGLELAPAATSAQPDPASPQGRGAFVGRQAEVGELLSGLQDALAGRGALFLIAGEPGIGKSRLAEELVVRARARGARVLVGRCWEAGGAPAYWPWVQSLRSYVGEVDPEDLREELGMGAAELVQLLPELRERLAELPQPPSLDPETARFRLFDAVTGFLRRAAARRPLVLVLDDLHAADEPSLLLLQFVARSLTDSHLLVLAAYRDVDPNPCEPLVTMVAELTRERTTRRIALAGLGARDIDEFISVTTGFTPPAAVVATIHAQTEGNALFVDEVTRLLIAENALDDDPVGVGIPQGIRDVIGRRMRRLSESCRETLVTASVLGREFSIGALAQMTGLEPREALEQLDEALAARAVSEVPGRPSGCASPTRSSATRSTTG